MEDLSFTAKYGTHDEFLGEYVGSGCDPTALLVSATGNRVPRERVAIVNRLLGDGADASVIKGRDRVNAIHVLFGHWASDLDFALEADMLARLLDSGADINQCSPRFGYPMEALAAMAAPDSEIVPFYDVIFSRDALDLDVIINKHRGYTLRDLLFASEEGSPELARRAREYDRRHKE